MKLINRNNPRWMLVALLIFSLLGNVYLFLEKNNVERAFYAQLSSTYEIEAILRSRPDNLDIRSIKRAAEKSFGESNVYVVDIKGENITIESGIDDTAIGLTDSIIYFKNGIYAGSSSRESLF